MVNERPEDTRRAKRQLRFQQMARRANRSTQDRLAAAEAIRDRALEIPEIAAAETLACYVSTPEEPGTGPLIEELSARGCTVLLPLLRPDFDLGWAAYQPGALREARFGISEPTGEPLGLEAISAAAVIFCPGLAADERGHRLGRGGGSYDRVLARLSPSVLSIGLLYDDEVLPAVPADEHDQPVQVIVTPDRTIRI